MLRSDCSFALAVMCFLSFLKKCKVHIPIPKDNMQLPHFLFQQSWFPMGPWKKSFATLFKKCLVTFIFPKSTILLRLDYFRILESGDSKNLALPGCANILMLCFDSLYTRVVRQCASALHWRTFLLATLQHMVHCFLRYYAGVFWSD